MSILSLPFSRPKSAGFCFLISFFLLSGISVLGQYFEGVDVIKTSAKMSKRTSATTRLDDEMLPLHILVGAFYTTRGGMESKLLMNNKAPTPIEVLPILYGDNGAILQIPTFSVDRNSFTSINLRDWADLGGDGFLKGNLKLFHRGKDLVLGTQIQITDESKSLAFENKLNELGKFDSRRFEGVWWIPNNNTESNVVLTNTSDEFLTVTAVLTRKPHNVGSPKTVKLLPHQTKVLDVREDFPDGDIFAKSKVLGLSLSHDSNIADALVAWTMVKDESKGFSNGANFTNPIKVKSNQYHGAGLQIGSIGSDELEPIVVLRNTSDVKIDVDVKVKYTRQNGNRGTVSINTIKLNPQEVHQVNMQSVANLNNVRTAGIEIEYSGSPGSIIASAQSVRVFLRLNHGCKTQEYLHTNVSGRLGQYRAPPLFRPQVLSRPYLSQHRSCR